MRRRVALLLAVPLLGLGACHAAPPPASPRGSPAVSGSPAGAPDHVLVVVFENKSYQQIAGDPKAPYLNSLIRQSAVFPDATAETHPSQPNYLALFSGSTQTVTSDRCPLYLGDRPNLGRQLLDAGLGFAAYAEDLPQTGYTGCASGGYAAKHAPWTHFANLPPTTNRRYADFPADYARLPTVAFVIPNLCDDMHDCPVAAGDAWARTHLDGYLRWAAAHRSLLVVTFDENDGEAGNRILTLIAGSGVRPGAYPEPVNHYRLLATIEHLYGLPSLGHAADAPPITDIWR